MLRLTCQDKLCRPTNAKGCRDVACLLWMETSAFSSLTQSEPPWIRRRRKATRANRQAVHDGARHHGLDAEGSLIRRLLGVMLDGLR